MEHRRKLIVWSLPIVLALIVPILYTLGLVTVSTAMITIDVNGVVYGTVSGEVLGSLNEISLPTFPIPASVEVYVNDTMIPAIVVNNTVYVPARGKSSFTIKYVSNTTVSNGVFKVDIVAKDTITMIIAPNVVLLSMPEKIINTYYLDDNLAFVFEGPATIEYTIKEAPPTENEAPPIMPSYLDLRSLIVIAAILIGTGILIYFYRYRRRSKLELDEYAMRELDEVDMSIIDALKSTSSKTMYQSDLQRVLRLPKTTLWRHIRRLERLGYVEIVKDNRRNKIILKKEH